MHKKGKKGFFIRIVHVTMPQREIFTNVFILSMFHLSTQPIILSSMIKIQPKITQQSKFKVQTHSFLV